MASNKNHRLNAGFQSANTEENKENVQIKQLQDKVQELEKKLTQHEIEIKDLKDIVMRK